MRLALITPEGQFMVDKQPSAPDVAPTEPLDMVALCKAANIEALRVSTKVNQ